MFPSRRQTLLLLLTSLVGCIPAPPSDPPVEPPVESPAPESWKPASSLATERAGHRAVQLADGRVLLFWGGQPDSARVPGLEMYDPATSLWSFAPYPARSGGSVTALASGRVLLAGGVTTILGSRVDASPSLIAHSWNYYASHPTQQYDPVTATWQSIGVLNPPREGHTAVELLDGRVLILRGLSPNPESTALINQTSVSVYDPVTNAWSDTGSMADPIRFEFTVVRLKDGKVLVAGGNDGTTPKRKAEVYDPATGTWSPAGEMPLPRARMEGAVLPSGQVLLMGGVAVPNGARTDYCRADAQLYDPATNQWRVVGSLAQARINHTATVLPDGRVLVTGGSIVDISSGKVQALASTELYDPAAGTWSAGLPMSTQRSSHTATLLRSGEVLVVGGFMTLTGYQIPQATVELYHPGPRP